MQSLPCAAAHGIFVCFNTLFGICGNAWIDYRRLDASLYKQAVENLIIVCVDVVLRRRSDGKLLLFYRRDKPANAIWWWPGGRMFRGETFFDTCIRKIRDETGNQMADVVPVGIVNTWNTFFPDSNWDLGRAPGKEGTQTVNIVVFAEIGDGELELNTEASKSWAVEAKRWVSVREALSLGRYDKYVRLNVEQAVTLGYLSV
jgi:ADP-ribose pyrophosphatase YjhB (NUDIX family)